MEGSSEKANSDFRPLGVFYSLVYWNEKFSPAFNTVFKQSENLSVYRVLAVILVFSVLFSLLAYTWFDYALRLVFLLFSLFSGILVGAEFPLANSEYLRISPDLSGTAGLLYSADLMGGWLGGMLGAVVLLPVLGLFQTVIALVMLKICSFSLLIVACKRQSHATHTG